MAKANIMIVEDEAIIAQEIKICLKEMDHTITSIVKTGEQALEKAHQDRPDLILMDIHLKGQMDGIKAAEIIRDRFNIPVTFLTAHADEKRLEQAKLTMPFGYVLKPFQDKDLKVAIDMGLFVAKTNAKKRQAEEALKKAYDALEIRIDERTVELAKANEVLIEEEERYRTLLENIPQKIFIKDKNLFYLSCCKKYAQDLKIKPEEIKGNDDFKFFPTALAEKYRADDQAIIESGKTTVIEEDYIMDEQTFTVRTVKAPVKDKAGNITGVIGIFEDITNLKQMEKVVQESEKKYRLLIENQTDLVSRDDT